MINNSYYIKKFKEFLRKEGVATQFHVNCYTLKRFPIYSVDKLLKKEMFPLRFVSSAFTWSDSKEGHMFWLEIDLRWRELYGIISRYHPK